MDARKVAFLTLLIVSGSTLIGSVLGAVYELSFGWWLVTVAASVAVAALGVYLLNKLTE